MSALDHLWAGWRAEFVGSAGPDSHHEKDAKKAQDAAGCVFCGLLASGLPDEQIHVVWRHGSGLVLAVLNAYPYTSGHLMVLPSRHVADLEGLEAEERAQVWEGVRAAVQAVKAAYKPQGVNLGANLGKAAGAGIPGHFHMHVVPRWGGDTNFMTAVADARVLPEPLSESATKLRRAWPPG